MTIRKIEAGRVITKDIDTFIGQEGTIFYDEQTGEFRLSDGITEGGIPLGAGGGGYVLTTATFTRLGGVRIGTGISVSPNGTISVNTGTPYVLTVANTSTLGGVIIGAGIDVSPSGVISVNTGTTFNLNTATTNTLGGVKIGTGIDVSEDGTISVNTGTTFNLNTATTNTLGGVKIGDGINVSEDGTISVNSSTYFTLTAGTDTAVSTSTGNVTVWNISTLQSVTNRGSTTSNAINITNTTTGALTVAGGSSIGGNLYVGGDITGPNGSLVLIATTSTAPNRQNGQLWFNSEDGRAYIKYNDNWVDFSPTIVPPVSTYLGELTIDGTTISTIDSTLTNIYIDSILDVTGPIYTNDYLVSTLTNIINGIGIGVSRTNSGTVTVSNTGVLEIVAGVDTSISTATGSVVINNTSTLQSVTNRGSTTSNAINITNTTTGALTVAGGVSIGSDLYVGGDIRDINGSVIHIATTSTAPNRVNGQIWFNSEDGRAYIKYNNNWVDLSPSIVPPTSTYLDGLVIEDTTIRTVDTTATTVYIDSNLDVSGEIFRNGISIGFGYTGSQGYIGSQGYTGSQGYIGSQGYTGSTGTQGYTGYTGSTGTQGYTGFTGSQGDTGEQGLQGTTGTQGPRGYTGEQGVSVTLIGSTATVSGLPAIGNPGDGWIVNEDGDLYFWNTITSSWNNVGQIVGPQGAEGLQGNMGPQGPRGNTGTQGIIGFTGSTGTQGEIGFTGSIGYTGSTGTQGITGFTGSTGTQGVTGFTGSIGYTGSAVIGLTSNAIDTVTLSTGFKFIPETDKLQDLGGPSNRFGKLYLAGQTIFLGDTVISIGDSGDLQLKNSIGELEKITVDSLKIGSTGTDGIVLSFSSGTFAIKANGTNITNILSTGTITATNIIIPGIDISTSTNTGALIVGGGVGIGGNLNVGSSITAGPIYDSNNRVVTSVIATGSTYIGITNLISTGTQTSFTIVNLGVQTLTAGTDTAINTSTGEVTIWTTSTLQSVTNRGNSTTNAIIITNSTTATSTITGALVVSGGVGIGDTLYVNTTSFVAGAEILTTGTIEKYAVTPTGIQTLTNKTIIVPNAGALYFDGDVALSQLHGALMPYKQTSAAPRMYTNADFGNGVMWIDAGEFNPDDGWNVIDYVDNPSLLPVGYTGAVYDAYVTNNDTHVWYWAALSITDLKPGDLYYDDVNYSVNLCFLERDSAGGEKYSMLDITPR